MKALLKNNQVKNYTLESVMNNAISVQEKCSLKISELEWLTTEQAANYLKIHIGTLRNWSSNGRISFYKVGRSNRYLLSDLVNFLLKNKKGELNYGN